MAAQRINPDPIDEEKMVMPNSYNEEPVHVPTSRFGLILAVLIVALMLILGGLYVWGSTMRTTNIPQPIEVERPTAEENNEPESTNAEADVETFDALSTSDELQAIEADLESTHTESLDTELNAIDAEFQAN